MVVTILFYLVVLATSEHAGGRVLILTLMIAAILLSNVFAVKALGKGSRTLLLLSVLTWIYHDNGLENILILSC